MSFVKKLVSKSSVRNDTQDLKVHVTLAVLVGLIKSAALVFEDRGNDLFITKSGSESESNVIPCGQLLKVNKQHINSKFDLVRLLDSLKVAGNFELPVVLKVRIFIPKQLLSASVEDKLPEYSAEPSAPKEETSPLQLPVPLSTAEVPEINPLSDSKSDGVTRLQLECSTQIESIQETIAKVLNSRMSPICTSIVNTGIIVRDGLRDEAQMISDALVEKVKSEINAAKLDALEGIRKARVACEEEILKTRVACTREYDDKMKKSQAALEESDRRYKILLDLKEAQAYQAAKSNSQNNHFAVNMPPGMNLHHRF